jgi:hypothetical protein
MDVLEQHFRSGEARVDLVAALGAAALVVLPLRTSTGSPWFAAVLIVFAVLHGWRAIRAWRKPYVLLTDERLVVFDHGLAKHYVELAAIESVRSGLNSGSSRNSGGVRPPDGQAARSEQEPHSSCGAERPRGLGLRQPSGALREACYFRGERRFRARDGGRESGGGPPHSRTLARFRKRFGDSSPRNSVKNLNSTVLSMRD